MNFYRLALSVCTFAIFFGAQAQDLAPIQLRLSRTLSTLPATGDAKPPEVTATQLPADHPLVGTWRIELPGFKCFEEYEVRADGTRLSQSAEERIESVHSISLAPSPSGYYKWAEMIVKNNGKPDCSGAVAAVGRAVSVYSRVNPNGQRMFLCRAEDSNTCYAQFQRKR